MNVLLTGGAGFIGSHTAVVLTEAGHNVIIFDNFCNSNQIVLERLKQILKHDLNCVKGDVRNTALLTKALQDYKIDAVVHFAGLKSVGESVERPIEYYASNVQGTISLLEAMKLSNIKSLVFSSSATVYGNPQYLPIDENHPTSATSAYGRSKLHIEEMLKDVAASDCAWSIICLRYFNPAGAHESGLIGEDPKGAPNNLLPFIAQVAAGKFPNLKVYGDDYQTPDGTGVRDYIHVVDLALGHSAAINILPHHRGWEAINLGTGRGYSVLEVIAEYRRASKKCIEYVIVPRRPGDIPICYGGIKKATDLLNWSAKRALSEVCNSSWYWIQQKSKNPFI